MLSVCAVTGSEKSPPGGLTAPTILPGEEGRRGGWGGGGGTGQGGRRRGRAGREGEVTGKNIE